MFRKKKGGVREMRIRILIGMCSVALIIFTVGCATVGSVPVGSVPTGMLYTGATGPVGVAAANYPEYEIIGPAEGYSSAVGVLGIIATGDAGVSKAYEDAIRKARADALINVQVDQKVKSIFSLFSKHWTIVKGTAVKFKK